VSSLKAIEKRVFEDLFGMASGYVLDFSNNTFAEFSVRLPVSTFMRRNRQMGFGGQGGPCGRCITGRGHV